MPGSDDQWHPGRLALFLALAALLYAVLFLASDAILRAHGQRNPFLRIALAPEQVDLVILGASHAMPLGFADMPQHIEAATGHSVLVLGVTGGGPFVSRLVAERFFADHRATQVLVVLDAFGFADARWNAARIGDGDMMPKIPADRRTLQVLAAALPRGLRWQALLDYATGFSRIGDRARFSLDRWEAEDRFDASPRPSAAADAARVAFLYPSPPSPRALAQGLDDLEALVGLAQAQGAAVTLVLPPLPDRFRALLPEVPGFADGLEALAARRGVPLVDFSRTIPESRFYFDSDHLNRAGVLRWLDAGLAETLRAAEDRAR